MAVYNAMFPWRLEICTRQRATSDFIDVFAMR